MKAMQCEVCGKALFLYHGVWRHQGGSSRGGWHAPVPVASGGPEQSEET